MPFLTPAAVLETPAGTRDQWIPIRARALMFDVFTSRRIDKNLMNKVSGAVGRGSELGVLGQRSCCPVARTAGGGGKSYAGRIQPPNLGSNVG